MLTPSDFPECDKSFTRTDALQKHMRIQHGEGTSSAAAGKKAQASTSKKGTTGAKKGGRAGSYDSTGDADDDFPAPFEEQDLDDSSAGAGDAWTESDLALFARHPDMSRDAVAYVVAKAKWRYLLSEHEGLLHEAEALGTREMQLKAQCGDLVDRIMRKELGTADETGWVLAHV